VPSLTVKLPLRSHHPSPLRRALHHPLFAIAPSIAAHCRCALSPLPPCLRRPLPLRSRRTISHRPGAVAPPIAIEEPPRRTLPSRSRRPCRLTTPATRHAPPRPLVWMVVTLPLLTPPPSICQRLSLRHRLSRLSSVRLVVPSPSFSRRHLPSAGASASHCTVASCHAPLGPLVQLVKASPLLTPPPEDSV